MMPSKLKAGLMGLILLVLVYILFFHTGKMWMGYELYVSPQAYSYLTVAEKEINKPSTDLSRLINNQQPRDAQEPFFSPYKEKSIQTSDTKGVNRKVVVRRTGDLLFRSSPLVIWSSDFHISPIRDLKHLLQPLGVEFIDKSLSGHCHLTQSCARGLRILNPMNGIGLEDPRLIPSFFEAYKNDPEMQWVDAFICYHPSSMCELYMPFNKSLIVIASTRYEMGRHDPNRWKNWNQNLIKISKDPKNIVAGNNEYDAKYIEYFTGIKAQVLPSYCGYISETYNPSRPEFLLAEVHQGQFDAIFWDMFKQSKYTKSSKVDMVSIRQRYPVYQFSDLTAHKGIVYVPYQVSIMSLFEQYRMNIPLFFPSIDLLTDWQFQFHVMTERTWSQVGGIIPGGSPIQGVKEGIPDPNDERSKVALKYWIKYADFYTMPHIIHYTSTDDLVFKMETTNLTEVSDKMKKYNAEFKVELLNKWKKILRNIYKRSTNHQQPQQNKMNDTKSYEKS